MILHNCAVDAAPDLKSIAVTAALFLVFYGSRYVLKKKISPILLIVISAAVGIVIF
jgi:chromate transporter